MRIVILAAVAGFGALTAAQSLSDLPGCAKECVGTSLSSTGCNLIDIGCICNSAGWIAGLSCCIANKCSSDEQATTIAFAGQLCRTANPPVTLPSSAFCASSSSPTAASTGSSTGNNVIGGALGTAFSSAASAALSSAASVASSIASGAMSVTSAANAATGTSSGTPSSASVASAAAATSTTGGAANLIGSGMCAAGAAFAAIALL